MTTIVDISANTPEAPNAPEDQMGARIAQKRQAKGLNHDGLSKLTKLLDAPTNAGISRTTIRGYEIGLYKPGARELRILSHTLEVTPTWLIFGGEDGSPSDTLGSTALDVHSKSDLEKGLVALFLLWKLDPAEREVVYAVLHTLARLKNGENIYRARTMAVEDVMALFNDGMADLREGASTDSEAMTNLAISYLPKLEAKLKDEFGLTLAEIFRKTA